MRYFVAFLLVSSFSLIAAEHVGVVRVQGKGVPGVAVVAVSGEQKIATSTDENGTYRLDLPPGQWTIEAELFAFEKQRKTITQADATTSAEWDLRFLAGPAAPAARRGFQAAQLEQTSDLPQLEAPALSTPS